MLIFWILNFEIAILYFVPTALLNTRLFSSSLAWVGFILMTVGALMVDYIILTGKADVLMTSYVPLLAHPVFYLGVILHAVGALDRRRQLLRHHLHRQAGPHLRGLGAPRRVRCHGRRHHRGGDAAPRRRHAGAHLAVVDRPDGRARPGLVPDHLVGPRPHVPAGERLRHGGGLVLPGDPHHRRQAAQPGGLPRRLRPLHPLHQRRLGASHPRRPGRRRVAGRSGTPRTPCTSRCWHR